MESNRKAALFWAALVLLVQVVAVAVLVPSGLIERAQQTERVWIEQMHTARTLAWIDALADRWHRTLLVDTGVNDAVRWMFLGDAVADGNARGMQGLGQNFWFPYIENRGAALNTFAKMALHRAAALLAWTPLLILVLIPSVFDGVMEWRIKQNTFDYPSPWIYQNGARIALWLVSLVGIGLLSPIPIPPVIAPLMLCLAAGVIGLMVIGNMPKRL